MSKKATYLTPKENARLNALEDNCRANASVALSILLKKKVTVSKPKVETLKAEALPNGIHAPRNLTANIQIGILESLPAVAVITLKREDGLRLVDLCLGRKAGATKNITEFERSALLETGGMLTANILSTIANTFKLIIMQTPPVMVFNLAGRIAQFANIGKKEKMNNAVIIGMELKIDKRKMPLTYVVLISDRSARRFLGWIKKKAGQKPRRIHKTGS